MRDGCKIEHNRGRYGGGVLVGAGSTLDAQGSYIGENSANMDGSQIYLGDGSWFTAQQANIPDEGLADPKVRLFDMSIYHDCSKEIDMMGETSPRQPPSGTDGSAFSRTMVLDCSHR